MPRPSSNPIQSLTARREIFEEALPDHRIGILRFLFGIIVSMSDQKLELAQQHTLGPRSLGQNIPLIPAPRPHDLYAFVFFILEHTHRGDSNPRRHRVSPRKPGVSHLAPCP